MLDGAALLLREQVWAGGDGEVKLRLVGDEVDLEAVEARRLVRAGDGRALVELPVPRDLARGLASALTKTRRGMCVRTYVDGDLGHRPGVHRAGRECIQTSVDPHASVRRTCSERARL